MNATMPQDATTLEAERAQMDALAVVLAKQFKFTAVYAQLVTNDNDDLMMGAVIGWMFCCSRLLLLRNLRQNRTHDELEELAGAVLFHVLGDL